MTASKRVRSFRSSRLRATTVRPAITVALALSTAFALYACGSSAPASGRAQGAGTTDMGGTAGASGASSGAGGGGPSGGGGTNGGSAGAGFNTTDGGGKAGQDLGDAACSGTSVVGEQLTMTKEITTVEPVAVYIMLDQSASMLEPSASGNDSKWTVVTTGIDSFVNDPASAGLDVGLNMFPPAGFASLTACLAGDCTGTDYANSVVDIAALPGNANAITSAIPASPGGLCTPTEPALRASEKACADYHQQHMNEKCVVVFVTDGVPNGCSKDQMVLTQIVSDAYTNDGTITFAVGMNVNGGVTVDGGGMAGSEIDFNLLDAIARAGHTDCNPTNPGNEACNVGGGSELSTALQQIRQTITTMQTTTVTTPVPCQWGIPAPDDGGMLDPAKVNVYFTTGGNKQGLGQTTMDQCGNVQGGWFYDDPSAPTTILACPDTCTAIQGAMDARIDIALGCKTIIAVPK